jgi:hypothetical protein
MKSQRVTFETAKLAKEKGFDGLCDDWFFIAPAGTLTAAKYDNTIHRRFMGYSVLEEEFVYELVGGQHGKTISSKCKNDKLAPRVVSAPTQSLLQNWLKEKHGFVLSDSSDNIDMEVVLQETLKLIK